MILNMIAKGSGGGGSGFTVDEIAEPKKITGDITITLGSGKYLRAYAFYDTAITSVSAPDITGAGTNGNYFAECASLETASLPSLAGTSTTTMQRIFSGCSNLVTVDMPYAWPRDYAFDGCSKLKKYINKLSTGSNLNIATGCFRNCSALEVLDFTRCTQIANTWAYNGADALTTLILRRTDDIVPCNNASNLPPVFRNGGAGGTVYVPNNLINTYKAASGWSTAYGYGTTTFTAIEGSYYATHYADGTSIS